MTQTHTTDTNARPADFTGTYQSPVTHCWAAALAGRSLGWYDTERLAESALMGAEALVRAGAMLPTEPAFDMRSKGTVHAWAEKAAQVLIDAGDPIPTDQDMIDAAEALGWSMGKLLAALKVNEQVAQAYARLATPPAVSCDIDSSSFILDGSGSLEISSYRRLVTLTAPEVAALRAFYSMPGVDTIITRAAAVAMTDYEAQYQAAQTADRARAGR